METEANHPGTSAVQLKYGDRVAVPMGLYEAIGQVEEVYGPKGYKHVMVRIPHYGPEGEVLREESVSFPIDWLRLVEAA